MSSKQLAGQPCTQLPVASFTCHMHDGHAQCTLQDANTATLTCHILWSAIHLQQDQLIVSILEQRPRHIQCHLWPYGWPVPAQVEAVDKGNPLVPARSGQEGVWEVPLGATQLWVCLEGGPAGVKGV